VVFFFFWIGWSGEDATTATQQPTTKRFSFNTYEYGVNIKAFGFSQLTH
jgi:hypothetical protein